MPKITGGRILKVEGKRDKLEPSKGMGINVNIDDVAADGDTITVQYTFTATYHDNVGMIRITGIINAKEEDAKIAEQIVKEWKEKRNLPNDFAEAIMNGVTYTCGVTGTFIAQPLGLNAPVLFRTVRIAKKPERKEGQGA